MYRALLLYGYNKFNLEILEYCEINKLVEREQYYINLLKPEYTAGSSLGYKHSNETLLKLKTRKLSYQARSVIVINNSTGKTTEFLSINKASIYINIDRSYVAK